ncbi:NAD(P)/FAD-dependent oxidoreductase [Halobium palmae]|uniref:NADH:ubiquinone reductase (non-electrogenic) n=1 Tax=Halobium palmae TaxID=1776492 RepID=A0ABD5RYL8_9EURY
MPAQIVVLGAGYAGVAAVQSLADQFDADEADLTWVSKESHHELVHECHRLIRKPGLRELATVPIEEVEPDRARFIEAEVSGIDVDDRTIELADESGVDYDYCLVCLGSQTAFYGIDGLEENARTVKSVDDGVEVNEALGEAALDATEDDPARAVVGGGGLTGIQTAGEIAAFRDRYDAPLEVTLVQESDHLFPGHDHEFQGALREKLDQRGVELETGNAVTRADGSGVYLGEDEEKLPYDVLVWSGGITGRDALANVDVKKDHNRVYADSTFESSDDRVFAIGDTGLVKQSEETGPLSEEKIWESVVDPDIEEGAVPPPTAEAAWEEGKHLARNVARHLNDEEPVEWGYTNKGTLVSVGDAAVAHGVMGSPVNTFSGPVARTLKKGITFRWLAEMASPGRAVKAWREL